MSEAAAHLPKGLLFIGVNSKMSNHGRRNIHRGSWFQHPLVKSGVVQAKFLLAGWAEELHRDDTRYGDCLRLPVQEGYHKLTQKTLAYLDWSKNSTNATYVMKLDDDSYPHLDGLIPYLTNNTSPFAYFGYVAHGPVHRTGRWAETKYDQEWYPNYMQGAGYILSKQLVSEIMKPGFVNATYSNENATVGIRVSWVKDYQDIRYVQLPTRLNGCSKGNVISMNWDVWKFQCVFRKEAAAMARSGPVQEKLTCC